MRTIRRHCSKLTSRWTKLISKCIRLAMNGSFKLGGPYGSTTTMFSTLSGSSMIGFDVEKSNGHLPSNDNDDRPTRSTRAMATNWLRNRARDACSKEQLKKQAKKKFPIVEWLPKYNLETAISDLIAGITVGLTTIPQAIAYALIAGLDPQYGLYSAFMGCFVYFFLGSSKDITVGPTAIMALMTAEHAKLGPDYAILLAFISGLIILLFGFLKLGFLIDFISVPVTAGFTSAAAITIASSQVKSLFGLEIVKHSHDEGLIGTWTEIVDNFADSIRWQDTVLGFTCMILLLLMRSMKNVTWFNDVREGEQPTGCQNRFSSLPPKLRFAINKTIWVVSTARNAIVVVVCALMASGFDPVIPDEPRNATFILTGDIESGLPPFRPPPFSTNGTSGEVSFGGMVGNLGTAIIIIPLIAILENVAIAKAFAHGKPVDASQEMIALGVCNILGSFVSSMPTTGSFSRTAVNAASGVKTCFGGIYTGALVLLALGVMMPYCAYIPKATLAAVIITAVIFSVEYEVIRPMWRSKKIDLIPAFATFFCCLFWALEYGILVGVAVQIFIILYTVARPTVHVQMRQLYGVDGPRYLLVSVDRGLVFPSITYVRNIVNKAGVRQGESRIPVVLDCSYVHGADFTAATGFKAMIGDFRSRRQPIVFFNPSQSVADTFLGVNIEGFVVVNTTEELNQHLQTILVDRVEQGPDDEAQGNGAAALLNDKSDLVDTEKSEPVVA